MSNTDGEDIQRIEGFNPGDKAYILTEEQYIKFEKQNDVIADLKFKLKNDAIFQEYSDLEKELASLREQLWEITKERDLLSVWVQQNMYETNFTITTDSTMNTQPEGKTAEEKKRAEKIFKLVVNEPDPELKAFRTNSDRYIPTTETDPNIVMASLRKKLTEANKEHDHLQQELASLREQLKQRDKELERLNNDLLDALDLKNGNGPTALSMLSEKLKQKEDENRELVNKMLDEAIGELWNLLETVDQYKTKEGIIHAATEILKSFKQQKNLSA